MLVGKQGNETLPGGAREPVSTRGKGEKCGSHLKTAQNGSANGQTGGEDD